MSYPSTGFLQRIKKFSARIRMKRMNLWHSIFSVPQQCWPWQSWWRITSESFPSQSCWWSWVVEWALCYFWLPLLALCVVPLSERRNPLSRGQPAVWPLPHSGRTGEWQSSQMLAGQESRSTEVAGPAMPHLSHLCFFLSVFFNWRKIALTCYVSFCHTTMLINHNCMHILPFLSLPPFLPSLPSRSSQSSRTGSPCYIATSHQLFSTF